MAGQTKQLDGLSKCSLCLSLNSRLRFSAETNLPERSLILLHQDAGGSVLFVGGIQRNLHGVVDSALGFLWGDRQVEEGVLGVEEEEWEGERLLEIGSAVNGDGVWCGYWERGGM